MIYEYFTSKPMFCQLLCGMAVACAIIPLRQSRERRTRLRIVLCALLIHLAVMPVYEHIVDGSNWTTAFEAPLRFLAAYSFCRAALRLSRRSSLYFTAWCYVLGDTMTQIFIPIGMTYMVGQDRSVPAALAVSLAVNAAAAVITYLIAGRIRAIVFREEKYLHVSTMGLLTAYLIVALYSLLSNYQFVFLLMNGSDAGGVRMVTAFRLLAGAASVFLLGFEASVERQREAARDLDIVNTLWVQQQEQFRISQENIDLINRKCHDLKYQIKALRGITDNEQAQRQIREMEHSVMIYDSVARTGNAVLDTVLMEKSLYCEEHGINMTCMADGGMLSHMDGVDLYTLFGNALDNAIENVMKQKDRSKRVIQISALEEQGTALIRVRNYCDEPVRFEDGLPVTTKTEQQGYHGFGTKSIRHIAEKYGGTMTCEANGLSFTLQVILPLPQTDRAAEKKES